MSPNNPAWRDGSVTKACFVSVLHLCQVEPEMALLDNKSGHRLLEGPRRDFRRPKSEISRRAQLLHQPLVGTTLEHLFQSLWLVYLQKYAYKAEAAWPAPLYALAARAGVTLQSLDGRCGRFLQVAPFCFHKCTANHSLLLGNVLVHPSHPAIEGSEDGGGRQAASGCERGHPRLFQLLMHLQKKGTE